MPFLLQSNSLCRTIKTRNISAFGGEIKYKIKVVYFHCEVSLEGKECEEVIFKFGRDGTVKER